MKSLNSLIRLHKRQVDLIAKELALTEEEKQKSEDRYKLLEAETKQELQNSAENPDYSYMLDKYLQNTHKKKELLKNKMHHIDDKIINLRAQLFEEFTEVKKFEIARDRKNQALKNQALTKEAKQLDEFNILQYSNNSNDK